jgi:hypothetical protein
MLKHSRAIVRTKLFERSLYCQEKNIRFTFFQATRFLRGLKSHLAPLKKFLEKDMGESLWVVFAWVCFRRFKKGVFPVDGKTRIRHVRCQDFPFHGGPHGSVYIHDDGAILGETNSESITPSNVYFPLSIQGKHRRRTGYRHFLPQFKKRTFFDLHFKDGSRGNRRKDRPAFASQPKAEP